MFIEHTVQGYLWKKIWDLTGNFWEKSKFVQIEKKISEFYVLTHKTVAILIKLGINPLRICKKSQN